MVRAFIAAVLLSLAAGAYAERLALGSLKTQDSNCRAQLFLEISAPQFHRVQGELRYCAYRGVEAVTLAELVANRGAAAPRFWEEFRVCSRYVEWVDADLAVEVSCR